MSRPWIPLAFALAGALGIIVAGCTRRIALHHARLEAKDLGLAQPDPLDALAAVSQKLESVLPET